MMPHDLMCFIVGVVTGMALFLALMMLQMSFSISFTKIKKD